LFSSTCFATGSSSSESPFEGSAESVDTEGIEREEEFFFKEEGNLSRIKPEL